MRKIFTITFICILFISCQRANEIEQIASDYYQTYIEREDFEKFMSFYADTAIVEDYIFGMRIEGKDQILTFFDWPHPFFTKLPEENFVITEQYLTDNKVITNGYLNPFKWKDIEVEPMYFTTQLTFNEDGKIIKHIDWINYPSYLINYETRFDSNKWIKY